VLAPKRGWWTKRIFSALLVLGEDAARSRTRNRHKRVNMNELPFEHDIRSTDPDATAHRKARFREGWRKAAAGQPYGEEALKQLT
jgi:hypothetical protein